MKHEDGQILFGRPDLGEEETAAVADVLKSGWIGMGPKVQQFEAELARYLSARHVVAVSSCTAALHLSLIAHGVGPGDEVITTPLTFVATGNAILYTGAVPVLVDVDPATLNVDPDRIAAAATKRTKAVMPVHFGGLPCEMDAIRDLAGQRGWAVIEDAAHALGAAYRGAPVGSRGTACFSFYPNKNLTTIEGGALATDSEEVARRATSLRLHGLSSHAWSRYRESKLLATDMEEIGYKYNMTDVSAAIGIVQLGKFPRLQEERFRQAARYDQAWRDSELLAPAQNNPPAGSTHARHLYVVLLKTAMLSRSRDEVVQSLRDRGIGASIHYQPLYREPYYRSRFGISPESFPACEGVYRSCITLPISPFYGDAEIDRVICAVKEVLSDARAK